MKLCEENKTQKIQELIQEGTAQIEILRNEQKHHIQHEQELKISEIYRKELHNKLNILYQEKEEEKLIENQKKLLELQVEEENNAIKNGRLQY